MLPQYPARIPLAQLPTPFRPLDRISKILGGPRIWLKSDDMTGSLLSGNKVRKLEYVIAKAKAEACDTLITCGGLQSNHCRATAFAGAQLGLKVHLLLRGSESAAADGNLLLDKLAGAEISVYEPEHYARELPGLLEAWRSHYANEGRKAWVIPTGASDCNGLWGYLAASEELTADFKANKIEPECIVCATGSGSTQAGLTLGFALQNSSTRVLGMAVCDSPSYFARKARGDIDDWCASVDESFVREHSEIIKRLNVNTNADYIGPGYGVAYDDIYETIHLLAREEGVVLDPVYTGKAFWGLMSEIKSGSFSGFRNIVFIHTGGIYGLFPHKNKLVEN